MSQILSMVDWVDSHYLYVKNRILTANPQRAFGGIVESRSWPLKNVALGSFYLLFGNNTPGRDANSWTAPGYTMQIRWVFQVTGTPVQNNVGAGGGDRYRTYMGMTQELLVGMWPGFCQKYTYSMNGATLTATPYSPAEYVWCSKPTFADTYDASNGIITGSGVTSLSGFSPYILS